ncbi:MAG TPA: DUF3047 domain-containing protein [Candidatus Limnocylindrales bacterium]|nr:DUF3047 domain-containing protein [Candidatus Limnocylindrales bacterium]
MKRAEARRRIVRALSAVLFLLFLPADAPGADPASALSAAGWVESTPGRWNRLPERKAVPADNALSGEFVLSPGTGLAWEKKGVWNLPAGAVLSFEFTSDGTNPSSEDYREFKARFPVSVTAVFGKDSQDLPWKKRVTDFFRQAWRGFPPGGIRLTYAFGNRVPVGSMYRLGEEETVFILAGEEEKGKKIQAKRDLPGDFRAAYGRDPKGAVTQIVVRAERPSAEQGPIRASVRITLPAP